MLCLSCSTQYLGKPPTTRMTRSSILRILISSIAALGLASEVGASGPSGVDSTDTSKAAPSLPLAFQRFDLNRDGVLSEAERAAASEAVQGGRPLPVSNAPVPRTKAEQAEDRRRLERARLESADEGAEPEQVDDAEPARASLAERAAKHAAKKTAASAQVRGDQAREKPRRADKPLIARESGDPTRKVAQRQSPASKNSAGQGAGSDKNQRQRADQKASADKRAAALRTQRARQAAEQAAAEAEAAEQARRESRLAAVRSEIARRRGEVDERFDARRTQEAEREAAITENEAWKTVSKLKSKPVKAPQGKFSMGRTGVKHGKKRGSKYYASQIKRAARTGGGRGRRGGKGFKGKNNNYNY